MNAFEFYHSFSPDNLYTAPGHHVQLYIPCKKTFCIPGTLQRPHDIYGGNISVATDHSWSKPVFTTPPTHTEWVFFLFSFRNIKVKMIPVIPIPIVRNMKKK
jgi:hypothetical protein